MDAQALKAKYAPKFLHVVATLCFGATERQKLWGMLATHLQFDLALLDSLNMYRNRLLARNSPLELVMDEVIAAYRDGTPLDEAFSTFIPPEEAMLLRAGTKGDLPHALQLCVKLIEAKKGITNSLVSSLAYPLVLVVMFIAMLCVLSFVVLPELKLLGDPSDWGLAARLLFGLADFLASPLGGLCFIALFLALIAAFVSLPRWTGPWRLRVEDTAPWSIYRMLYGATWMFSVATLMQAGMKFIFILDDMLELTHMSPWLRERVLRIRQEYQHGDKLATALKASDMNFPDKEVIEDLVAFEDLPSFNANFYDIACDWLNKSQQKITQKLKAISGIIMLGIGVLMCGVAVATKAMQQAMNYGGF